MWHGGERTGRTPTGAKRGFVRARLGGVVPGVGSDHGHESVPGWLR
ncbi:hypothetical protein SBD_2747 [Streptomyces bottropensis ATCC 25435]|uniref:Uncharacterized protein n=1 Tax=Streptomyces bottropensis ATCC 25435 TaxID=1054862 RepID=M3FR47_9ACTN|nr:hypothetical protein SBD_2747 [Streptomyces bottropensis ATCC 25435]